jgi:hypothetical protein
MVGFFPISKIVNEFCRRTLRSFYEGEIVSRYAEIKKATAQVVGIQVVRRDSTVTAHAAIRDVIASNPGMSYREIANLMGCSRWLIYRVAVEFGIRRPRGAGSPSRRLTR